MHSEVVGIVIVAAVVVVVVVGVIAILLATILLSIQYANCSCGLHFALNSGRCNYYFCWSFSRSVFH